MENNQSLNFIFTILISFELLIVAYLDIKTKKIKNYWSVVNTLLAAILITVNSTFSLEIFKLPLIILVVGFMLFAIKLMGAGDVKFLTTMSLFIPIMHQNIFVQSFLVSLILYSIILFFIKLFIYQKDFKLYWKNHQLLMGVLFLIKKKEAFAPCIFLAWIIFLIQLGGMNVFN